MSKTDFDKSIKLRITKISQKNDKISFKTCFEGYPVRTRVDLKDDGMHGHVVTPEVNCLLHAKKNHPRSNYYSNISA